MIFHFHIFKIFRDLGIDCSIRINKRFLAIIDTFEITLIFSEHFVRLLDMSEELNSIGKLLHQTCCLICICIPFSPSVRE